LKKKGRRFECTTIDKDTGKEIELCKPEVQKRRRCHEDRWNFGPEDGATFPIYLGQGSSGFGFCPAKLFRDDVPFVMLLKDLIVKWKCGGLNVDDMQLEEYEILYDLIIMWEQEQRAQDFKVLGSMLGGKSEGKGQNNSRVQR